MLLKLLAVTVAKQIVRVNILWHRHFPLRLQNILRVEAVIYRERGTVTVVNENNFARLVLIDAYLFLDNKAGAWKHYDDPDSGLRKD